MNGKSPSATSLGNFGVIQFGPAPAQASLPRTIIATGIGRSGTSMVAAVLAGIGLLSREDAYDVTLDDREFLHVFSLHDRAGLAAIIARRNHNRAAWAFKMPSLQGYLLPHEVDLFRNPHLIVVMRDVVATARRHATAEHVDPAESMFETARGQADLLAFLQQLRCPILAVSYEKAVLHPGPFVRAVADFVRARLDEAQQNQLAALVEPDNTTYAQTATRHYDGNVDGMFQGHLRGWCREIGEDAPLSLELLVNGIPACTVRADAFRDDLKKAGIGEGRYGFDIDTIKLKLPPGAILAVHVAGRTFQVPGSGKPAWMYQR